MNSFINLKVHSHYSLLRSPPKIPEIVARAKELGHNAVGLTDYSNFYGAIEFYKECIKQKIKPILGVECTLANKDGERSQLTLLAKNTKGYKNILRLISIISLENPSDPIVTDDLLSIYARECFLFSGGPYGDISRLLIQNKNEAYKRVLFYRSIVGDDSFYLEVTPHIFMERGQEIRTETISFSLEKEIPLVATINTHYIHPEDKSSQKTLILVSDIPDVALFYSHYFQNGAFHFYNNEEIESSFSDCKQALFNTLDISDRCNLEIDLGSWVFPNIEYTVSYNDDLRTLAYAGIAKRGLEETKETISRLEYELKVIADKGYSPYFLVVYDLLRFARENHILTNIRGSVAGSLITYLLQITKCNPLVYKLPFERFLNPERPSAPDIDMDFADTKRDMVIDYARKKYGLDNVAQIGTFGTMMARGAIKDVARAMKFPYMVGDRISKMIPMPKQGFPVTIDGALLDVPELKEMYTTDREVQLILDMARKVEGCARHISVHAAGTVISPSPLWDFTPIQKDPKGGKIITQYDMYTIEDAGLLKFDFLGIRNLTILGDAITLVKKHYSIDVDIEEIPIDDSKTFKMLARGETTGLFQLNGSGMTRFLKELEPSTIFDINAMVALYRPGPLEMIPEYIRRKKDTSLVEYLDPRLEPILDQSFGVITYQDDVMLIAIHLAGYSWLEADKLRKAMGKKIPEEMLAQKEKLLQGFVSHGLSAKKAQELWLRIEPFAAYGFNKAHAASYGRVAYQTAYMKANFPFAYMTAVLSNESGDVEKIAEIVGECARMGITVLPPDVNVSTGGFSIIKNKDDTEEIRFGLYTIKGLGTSIADAIVDERIKGGMYTSFENFITRIMHKDLNKRSLDALTKSGALDALGLREDILFNLEEILDYHKNISKSSNQGSLFDIESGPTFTLKKTTPIPPAIKLQWEKELLGLYVSGFPLDPWKEKIIARNVDIHRILTEKKDGETLSLACLIETIRITKTKKGDAMALLTLRDYSGSIEVALFPETYAKNKQLCLLDTPLIIKGKVSTRNNEKTMIIEGLQRLG